MINWSEVQNALKTPEQRQHEMEEAKARKDDTIRAELRRLAAEVVPELAELSQRIAKYSDVAPELDFGGSWATIHVGDCSFGVRFEDREMCWYIIENDARHKIFFNRRPGFDDWALVGDQEHPLDIPDYFNNQLKAFLHRIPRKP